MKLSAKERRKKRHERIRKRIYGMGDKPRLCVFRSDKHLYAQAIDDHEGKTLFSFSTLDAKFRKAVPKGNSVEAAKKLGQAMGPLLLQKGIQKVIFDRNGDKYHGRVKALAEALRETGVKF